MKRLSLISLFLALVCLPLTAQQMSIEDFTRLKGRSAQKDKSAALLDLVTAESGFTVLSGANKAVEIQAQEGFIRLLLPDKTTKLAIQHPAYGQLAWQTPGFKPLRKGKHYRATLCTQDPSQEYKATHQWVVMHFSPENAVLQLDSLSMPIRQDVVEFYLPLGDHSYRLEAPFFAPQEGSFTLSDSARTNLSVTLQPFYSYLTVQSSWKKGKLYIDGGAVSWNEATSFRLNEGKHRVSVFRKGRCYLDSVLVVGPAAKEILTLKKEDFKLLPLKLEDLANFNPRQQDADSVQFAPVKLSCKDSVAFIVVDRECVGKGSWEGQLPMGFHLLSARKNGQDGPSVRLMLEDAFPQEITLMAPGVSSGLVNIHCNVNGARIMIDGEDRGTTPCIVQLDASHLYEVIVYKPGYKDWKTKLRPRGNNQVDLNVKLKKRKI